MASARSTYPARTGLPAWLGAATLAVVLASEATAAEIVVGPGMRIGVVGGDRASAVAARLDPFRRYVAEEIGAPVELLPFKDGLTLVDAAATGRIDYAILSASAYAMAWRVCGCIEPLAAPRSADGTVSYRSVLVTRAAAGVGSVKDLKGKVLAAADLRSIAGRLVPMQGLADTEADPATHFGRIETVRGPETAMRLLLSGKADAAIAWTTLEGDAAAGYSRGTLRDLVDKRALDMADIRIVWRSAAIPHGPHAVRSDLAPDLKARLRDALIRLKADDPDAYEAVEPEFGGGFTDIAHGAYEPLLMLVTPTPKPIPEPIAGSTPLRQ